MALDLWAGYYPLPTGQKFLRSKAKYRLLSSGYGSGKSKLGCRESIRHALQYPGTRHLVGRFHATDLNQTTRVTFFKELGEIGLEMGTHYTFNKNDNIIKWANGSETLFVNLDDPTGAKYGSLEITTAFIDEGSEVPGHVYQVLYPSRMRWHVPGCPMQEKIHELLAAGKRAEAENTHCDCPLRSWVCTNPGPSSYLQQVVRGQMDEWEWFPVPAFENPFNGPEWKADMENKAKVYGQHWFEAYINGSWDSFEGQRFMMFDRAKHTNLPENWEYNPRRHFVVEGWDFGFRESFVVWIAIDEHNEDPPVVFDELQAQHREADWIAAEVHKRRQGWGIDQGRMLSFGDPGGRQRGLTTGVSPIGFYAEQGIYIAPCDAGKLPTARADLIARFLADRSTHYGGDGKSIPGILFHPRCTALIDSVINYAWDESQNNKGEDAPEKFLKKNDHGVDALGYGLVGCPAPDTIDQPREYRNLNFAPTQSDLIA